MRRRRWQQRGEQHEESGEQLGSLKQAAMALQSPQFIFGDFSPDEFNQFFVTPRSSVEVKQNFVLLSICVNKVNGYVLILIF